MKLQRKIYKSLNYRNNIKMGTVFNTIKKILHEQYSIQFDQIQPETKFELELGTDSREFFELITDFENAFDIKIMFNDIPDIVTIQDAVNYIEELLYQKEADENSY